eukprot:c23673_g1_i4 orf=359-3466(-)
MSGSTEGSTPVESSVGTLVWVRRRNGSWWPGRILGPEELPGSHLLSPRSGTPVKLLGREDASVDWYNIQKSKRVKAFRCGEFDECIEKVKSIAGLPSKRREKYARREDAIFHALELEKKQIEEKHLVGLLPTGQGFMVCSDEVGDRRLDSSGQESDGGSDFLKTNLSIGAMQPLVSIQCEQVLPDICAGSSQQREQKLTCANWEGDTIESIAQIRGHRDFGSRISSSKKTVLNWSNTLEGAPMISVRENDSSITNCKSKSMAAERLLNSSKDSIFVLKRKRSQVGALPEETTYKRRDRRRPLTQVLESSAKLSDFNFGDLGFGLKDAEFDPCAPDHEGFVACEDQERRMGSLTEEFMEVNGLDYQSTRQGLGSHVASQNALVSKQDGFNSSSAVVDNSCSSFSDQLNANCCNGRPMQLASQIKAASLAGSAFVDSLLRNGLLSASSICSGSTIDANDAGLDKASSISVPSVEKFIQSSSFQVCSNSGAKNATCDKLVNWFGLNPSTGRASCLSNCLLQSVNNLNLGSDLPLSFTCAESARDLRSLYAKKGTNDIESSSLLTASDLDEDWVKPKHTLPSQGILSVSDGCRSLVLGEDEAESFKIPTGAMKNHAKRLAFSPGTVSMGSNEGLDKKGFYNLNRCNHTGQVSEVVADMTVSKWQTKRRRNARVLQKRQLDSSCRRNSRYSLLELTEQSQEKAVTLDEDWKCDLEKEGLSSMVNIVHPDRTLGGDDGAGSMRDSSHALSHRNGEGHKGISYLSDPKSFNSSKRNIEMKIIPCRRGVNSSHLQMMDVNVGLSSHCQPNAFQLEETAWFDVSVEVQGSYQGERVPLVSLMSRHNGKAIVGHPVIVECLESGLRVCRTNITKNFKMQMRTLSRHKGKKGLLHPVWKTGRQKTMLHSHRSRTSVMDDVALQPFSQQETQTIPKLGFSGFFSHKKRLTKRSLPIVCWHKEKISRKVLQKAGTSPRKTKMLSSIAMNQIGRPEDQESALSMTPADQPSRACIPVKLVFSRIKEVLYGHSQPVVLDPDSLLLDAPKD